MILLLYDVYVLLINSTVKLTTEVLKQLATHDILNLLDI